MKTTTKDFKNVLAAILFSLSFSSLAAEIPDPEMLAKQYLKDLCTLNEQDFTRKYMLTQLDTEDFMKVLNKSYIESGETPSEMFSDSLAIRSEVHSLVVKSYRAFKEWQHENHIDSTKIKYHSCEFKLEKKRKIPYYSLDDMQINFSCDTTNYIFSCDDFIYLKTKWIGGDSDGISRADKYFNTLYDDYDDYGYAMDSTVAVDYDYAAEADYYENSEEGYADQPVTKKKLKIQKKIDAHNRKIDALYIKQYE